jgi:hypothetical protein
MMYVQNWRENGISLRPTTEFYVVKSSNDPHGYRKLNKPSISWFFGARIDDGGIAVVTVPDEL